MEQIVTKIEELSGRRRLVYINGEQAFALYSTEVRRYGIAEEKRLRRKTLNSSAQSFWIKGLSSVQCICYRQRTIQKRTDGKTAKGLLSTGIC